MSDGGSKQYRVATVAQVPPGCMKRVDVGEVAVVLYNLDGEIFASSDVCPHKGAPLSQGDLAEGVVMCPFHAWEFDVRTGECVSLPEARPLTRYEVRVEDGFVSVVL